MDVNNELFKPNRDWDNYKDILIKGKTYDYKDKPLAGYKIAKLVVKIFLELMFKDLIFNNDTFHFPLASTIKLRIANRKKTKKYRVELFGTNPQPWMILGYNFLSKCNGFFFYFNFSDKYKEMLFKEAETGHIYKNGQTVERELKPFKINDKVRQAYNGNYNDVSNYL